VKGSIEIHVDDDAAHIEEQSGRLVSGQWRSRRSSGLGKGGSFRRHGVMTNVMPDDPATPIA